MDVVGQGFLHVNVFAELHGCQRARRVHVVRRRNNDRVEVLVLLVEHFPVVFVRCAGR